MFLCKFMTHTHFLHLSQLYMLSPEKRRNEFPLSTMNHIKASHRLCLNSSVYLWVHLQQRRQRGSPLALPWAPRTNWGYTRLRTCSNRRNHCSNKQPQGLNPDSQHTDKPDCDTAAQKSQTGPRQQHKAAYNWGQLTSLSLQVYQCDWVITL